MAVIDEASIKITPDTSGFAEQLRAELEAEIAAATAGLDKTIKIHVETDADQAMQRARAALDTYVRDGSSAWAQLTGEERDYYTDRDQNEERSRVKATTEQRKLREALERNWKPARDKLKQELTREKNQLDQITQSAQKAAKALGSLGSDDGVAQSRQRAVEATERLLAAEDRLREVRSRENADIHELRDAELAVAHARSELNSANQEAVSSEERLARAHESTARATESQRQSVTRKLPVLDRLGESARRGEVAERALGRAHEESSRSADNHTRSLRGLGDGMDDSGRRGGILGGIMDTLGGAFAKAGDFASRFGSTLSSAVGSAAEFAAGKIKDVVQAMIQLGAQISLWFTIGEAVSYAVGAIGAALAGLPALISATGASFFVLALGFDNFGKAISDPKTKKEMEEKERALKALSPAARETAEVIDKQLKPAFHNLQQTIQQRLFEGMAPAVLRLKTLIEQMTGSAGNLAGAFNDVFKNLLAIVTTEQNIAQIKKIFDDTATSVRSDLGPALANLLQSFIDISAQGTILRNMVGIIADLTNNTANWFNEMRRSGEAERGVAALRSALDTAEKAIFNVLKAAVTFFADATPGFNKLVTAVGDLASSLLNDLGPSFGRVMSAAADFIKSIPPSSVDGFKDAIKDLARAFEDFANSRAPELIADGVNACVRAFTALLDFITPIADAIGLVKDAFNAAKDALGGFGGALEGLKNAVTNALNPIQGLINTVTWAGEKLGLIKPKAEEAGQGVSNGFVPPVQALPGQVQPPLDQTATAVERSMRDAQAAAAAGGQGVHDGIVNPLPAMQQTTQVTFDSLPPVVQQAMTGAAAAAQTGSDLVRNAVQTGFDAAANAATKDARAIERETVGAFQNMSSIIKTATDAISQGVRAMGQAIQEVSRIIVSSMQQARSAVEGGARAISSAFESNTKLAQTATTNAFRIILRTIQDAGRDMTKAMQDAWRDIKTAFDNGGRDAVNSATNTARQVVQVFVNTEPAMEQAGRNLIQRLANGMISQAAAAYAAAQRIAAGIRAQFPASPAKEGPLSGEGDPQKSGGKIAQRLAAGMIGELASVQFAAMQTAAAVAQAFSARGGWNAGNGGIMAEDGTFVNPHFYDTPAPNWDVVARQTQDIMRQYLPEAYNGGGAAVDTTSYNNQAQAFTDALAGMKLEFTPGSQTAMAQFVNSGNRALSRR